jgi:hypothetical protein
LGSQPRRTHFEFEPQFISGTSTAIANIFAYRETGSKIWIADCLNNRRVEKVESAVISLPGGERKGLILCKLDTDNLLCDVDLI